MSTIHYINSEGVEAYRPATPEELLKPTKTYKYLFEPFLKIYHTEGIREVFDTERSGIKIINVFLEDIGVSNYKFTDGILHIVCHVPGASSLKYLEKLKLGNQGHHYIGSYVVHNNPRIIVIQYKAMRGMAFRNFLNSNYKEMFKNHVLEKPEIKRQFIKGKTKDNKLTYTRQYRVFINDSSLRKSLAKKLKIDEDDLVQLASKLDFDRETVNIRKYIENVKDHLS